VTRRLRECAWTRLRLLVLGVMATLLVTAPAAVAQTVHPTFGRWEGSGSEGTVSFVVSRDHGTLVVHDVVARCAVAYGGDPDGYPSGLGYRTYAVYPVAFVEPDGRLNRSAYAVGHDTGGPVIEGSLGDVSGTVSVTSALAGDPLSAAPVGAHCPNGAFRNVHVAPVHARALRDGEYKVIEPFYGPEYDDGVFDVDGEGALIEWTASFDTPVGGEEDDPAACDEAQASALSNGGYQTDELSSPVLFNSTGAFSAQTSDLAPADLSTASFSVAFATSQAAAGAYVATSDYENTLVCAGAGAFTLTLSTPASLEPVEHKREPVPIPTPPTPTPPVREDACAMRFQIQLGSKTPYYEPVVSPRPVTVKQALAGLDAMESKVEHGMLKASAGAFANTRKWVRARPAQGGVGGVGNVKRSKFEYEKKKWRLDTENLRCQNLTS
jgi:hypothetical protein